MPLSPSLRGVRARLSSLAPRREDLRGDLVAGVPGAISSVPDGMAASILAGVSPVHGLYASMVGPIGGGLTASSKLMVITTTSAAALAAGSALESVSSEDRPQALFLLTLAGRRPDGRGRTAALRPVRPVRPPLGDDRLPDRGRDQHRLRSDPRPGRGRRVGTVRPGQVLGPRDPSQPDRAGDDRVRRGGPGRPCSGCAHTRLAAYSSLVALIIPSGIVAVVGSTTVELVSDVGAIPQGLPAPYLPHLSDLSVSLVTGALSVAALVLIQGAGVAESAPNPDGTRRRHEPQLPGSGRRQPALGAVPWPAGRRLGRPDRSQRLGRRPEPVGGDLRRPVDGGHPDRPVRPGRPGRDGHPRRRAHRRGDRIAARQTRSSRSCAPAGSHRSP